MTIKHCMIYSNVKCDLSILVTQKAFKLFEHILSLRGKNFYTYTLYIANEHKILVYLHFHLKLMRHD